MSINYGYYLPLAEDTYESVRFLGIAPKTSGPGSSEQKTDRSGQPQWVVSALVKYEGSKPETETFTLTAPKQFADRLAQVPELAPIRLVGLAAGKWTRAGTDKTTWSFQIASIEAAK